MYSEQKVAEKCHRFKEKYGWGLVPHSVEEVDRFNAGLKKLEKVDSKGSTYFDDSLLTASMKRFIQNERALAALSCEYFLTRYFWLTETDIQHFSFRSGQRAFFSVVQDLDERGVAQVIQCLKARKQGISTLVEGMMTHASLMVPGTRTSIGSADEQKTQVMMEMMYGALEHIPWWLSPTQTKDKRSGRALLQFSHIGTMVVIQHGAMRGGIGQGTTPNKIHLSEASQFTNPVAQIEEGLLKAVPLTPETLMVFESTGDGNTGWWAEQWRANKENYWKGKAEMLPLFLPWFMTPELYPTSNWIKKFPFPAGWRRGQTREVQAMIDKCQAYVKNTEILRKILGSKWVLPDEQVWYWQFKYEDSKLRRQEKSWSRQMPCVTGETLVSTNHGIIPIVKAADAQYCSTGIVTKWIPRGIKPIWELTTADGRILRATKEHRIRLLNGEWREMQDLRGGDALKLSEPKFPEANFLHKWNDTPLFHHERLIDEDMGKFLGYFMGDGCFSCETVDIACDAKDEDTIAETASLIEKFTGKPASIQRKGGLVRVRSGYKFWQPFLRSIGALKRYIHHDGHNDGWRRKVCVPECVMCSPRPVVRQFLRALFECDGHAYKKSPRVVLYSSHDEFLRQVQMLLLGFGIKAQFMKQKKISGASIRGGKRHEYTGRELVIRSAWVNQFYEQIGFAGSRKHNSGKRRVSEKYADATLYDEVKSVVSLGIEEEVFDLTIESSHCFGANGIEVHNCDDFEALVGDHDSVYGMEVIAEVESKRERQIEIFGLLGSGIKERHDPPPIEVDPSRSRLAVSWKTPAAIPLEWMLMPLRGNPEDGKFDPLKKLIVYKRPEKGSRYSVAIDPGTGVGGDRTAICVTRTGHESFPDIQVAEFASDDIDNVEIAAFASCIIAWYAQYYEEGETPRVIIEQKRKYGDSCYHALKLHGFRNHHIFRMYDKKTLRPRPSVNPREGWFTNEWSRPMLLSAYKHAVDNGWFKVNSRWLLAEMEGHEQRMTEGGKTRADHASGKHDDRLFAAAMSYFTNHDLDAMLEREHKRCLQPTGEVEWEIEPEPWMGSVVTNHAAEDFVALYAND